MSRILYRGSTEPDNSYETDLHGSSGSARRIERHVDDAFDMPVRWLAPVRCIPPISVEESTDTGKNSLDAGSARNRRLLRGMETVGERSEKRDNVIDILFGQDGRALWRPAKGRVHVDVGSISDR